MADLKFFILNNYDEIIGTLIALFYLYFSIKQKIWLWPLGFISSAIYAFIFYRSKIYAGMGLQVYYAIISVYGWYIWQKSKNGRGTQVSVKSLINSKKTILTLIIISIVLFIGLSQILVYYTDSQIPYFDAFITSLSIVATWMLAQKYIEHWWVWLLADSISVGVFFSNKLYFTTVLYLVYTLMAFLGFKTWKKDLVELKIIKS